MNIENFTPDYIILEEIFEKQKRINFMFEPELESRDFDIDLFEDQELFKKHCWRITEELMEALEDYDNPNHFKEELIDGFNFLINLYSLYGWDYPSHLNSTPDFKEGFMHSTEDRILKIIYQLGITANLLKNRSWRSSHYMVDQLLFESRFKKVWYYYLHLFYGLGMTLEDICKLWTLKNKVNLFRLETKY